MPVKGWQEQTFEVDIGQPEVIPLFAELHPYLREVFELVEPGTVYVITAWRSPEKNLRTRLMKALIRLGLKPWPKLCHNLRASAETDLAREYPLGTVVEWLGHNPAVMVTNYLTNPDLDADFQRAAKGAGKKQRAIQRARERIWVNLGGIRNWPVHQNPPKTLRNMKFPAMTVWAIQDSNL